MTEVASMTIKDLLGGTALLSGLPTIAVFISHLCSAQLFAARVHSSLSTTSRPLTRDWLPPLLATLRTTWRGHCLHIAAGAVGVICYHSVVVVERWSAYFFVQSTLASAPRYLVIEFIGN